MMKTSIALLATVVLAKDKKKVCRTLVLSGGANKGSWEAGVLNSFVKNLHERDTAYDVYSGVSIGALNSAYLAGYSKDDMRESSDDLVEFWRNQTQDKCFKPWDASYTDILLDKQGILDNSPMLEQAREILLAKGLVRKVVFGAVNANTGEYAIFNEHHKPFGELPTVIVASASVPFVFPPAHLVDGETYIDGGVAYNTNLIGAADRCLEEVEDDSQIIMDVMMCDHVGKLDNFKDTGSAYANYMRNWSINSYYAQVRDISQFMRERPNIQYRYLATASKPLTDGLDELNIGKQYVEWMIELGFQDGKDIVAKGPGYYFNKLIHFDEAKLNGYQGTFNDYIAE